MTTPDFDIDSYLKHITRRKDPSRLAKKAKEAGVAVFYARFLYGRILYYPQNKIAKALCRVAGTKTFDIPSQLESLRILNIRVELDGDTKEMDDTVKELLQLGNLNK